MLLYIAYMRKYGEQQKAYYLAHHEELKAKNRAYYQENKEYFRQYRLSHNMTAYNRAYYLKKKQLAIDAMQAKALERFQREGALRARGGPEAPGAEGDP